MSTPTAEVHLDGAEIGVEPELGPDAEQSIFGSCLRQRIIPLRTAHGAEDDGVGAAARLNG